MIARSMTIPKIILLMGLLILILINYSPADIFVLSNGITLNGIVLNEDSTSLEIQTISATMILPLSRISTWTREPNLQSYYRLSQEAFKQKRYSVAREFLQRSLRYDPHNTALISRLAEIDFALLEETEIKSIINKSFEKDPNQYLLAIQEMESLIKKYENQSFVSKLHRELANLRVQYALYLYNFVRNDEAFEQLRLARRTDEDNENLHRALARIQSNQGNELLAQLEEEQAREVARMEKERDEVLNQILASVQEPDCDDLPSSAYWAEQARLASLIKKPPIKASFALIPVANWMRILLQAYNAGPGAVVVYEGAVPYRETVNYVRSISNWLHRVPESNGYEHFIRKSSQKYNLDVALVRALIKVESDFNPRARSKADARGLMQLTRVTWNDTIGRLGVNWSFSQHAYDPEKNIEVGCHYLAWLKDQYLPKYFQMAGINIEENRVSSLD